MFHHFLQGSVESKTYPDNPANPACPVKSFAEDELAPPAQLNAEPVYPGLNFEEQCSGFSQGAAYLTWVYNKMKNLIFAIVFITPPFLKKFILRTFMGARFGRGSNISWFSSVVGKDIEIGDYSTIKPFTLIRCDGAVLIGKYTEVSSFSLIYGRANFQVGDKCYIGPQSLINVTEDVVIGNGVGIGPRTMIFTHGSFLPYTEGYWVRFGKVTIGNNVWMAAGVFVHPGVEIGNNVFINSRSVINQSISAGKVFEGNPAKEICDMDQMRRKVSPYRRDTLIRNILKHFCSFVEQTQRDSQITWENENWMTIRINRKAYQLCLVVSKGENQSYLEQNLNKDNVPIILINNEDWDSTFVKTETMVLNFVTKKATYSKDKMFQELYQFLKQYYGVIFEYE